MNKIKKITKEEASKIIDTRLPLGLFWLEEDGWFVGIDNRTGDAWTEDFETKNECFKYLREE